MGTKNQSGHWIRLVCFGLLLAAVMSGIFLLSSSSGEASESMSNGLMDNPIIRFFANTLPLLADTPEISIRKYAHVFEYGCLGISSFLFFYELLWKSRRQLFMTVLFSAVLSFVFACSDEWHQTFVDGRAGRISDLKFDSAGFALGIVFLLLLVLIGKRRREAALQ